MTLYYAIALKLKSIEFMRPPNWYKFVVMVFPPKAFQTFLGMEYEHSLENEMSTLILVKESQQCFLRRECHHCFSRMECHHCWHT